MRKRAGFTLIELLVGITVLGVLVAAAVAVLVRQQDHHAVARRRGYARAGANYGVAAIERVARVAGVGVISKQPMVLQADPFALTVNANLVTESGRDPGAVYITPDIDPALAIGLQPATKVTLPFSTFSYPDSAMVQGGVPTLAETISFFLAPDPDPDPEAPFALFKRVNRGPNELVARGFLRDPLLPVFRYFRTTASNARLEIPAARLPLVHTAATHGQPSDTGRFAWVDSISVIEVRLRARVRDPKRALFRTEVATIRLQLANAGLIQRARCGDIPLSAGAPTAVATTTPSRQVSLSWARQGDDGGGERDVDRYLIYRRLATETVWGEPMASIPGGLLTYRFADTDVMPGQSYQYALAPADCTPRVASIGAPVTVTIP